MWRKLYFSLLLMGSINHLYAGGCCCVPVVSCVSVIASMELATADNKIDITTEDTNVGNNWMQTIQKELTEITELKEKSLKKQKNISNLEYASLIETYKEEFNYLQILDYKKTSFQEKEITNKANLLEASLDIELNKKTKESFTDTEQFIKK